MQVSVIAPITISMLFLHQASFCPQTVRLHARKEDIEALLESLATWMLSKSLKGFCRASPPSLGLLRVMRQVEMVGEFLDILHSGSSAVPGMHYLSSILGMRLQVFVEA